MTRHLYICTFTVAGSIHTAADQWLPALLWVGAAGLVFVWPYVTKVVQR